jgi:hypothetical protein
MRRLALVFAIIAVISVSENMLMSGWFPKGVSAFAARMVRIPGEFGLALQRLQRLWRQRLKALPLADVN